MNASLQLCVCVSVCLSSCVQCWLSECVGCTVGTHMLMWSFVCACMCVCVSYAELASF